LSASIRPSIDPTIRVKRKDRSSLKLSVGRTSPVYLLEIEGLFTQGRRPGRTVGESVGGIFEMDSSDWSNGIRYHIFETRPDTEFKYRAFNMGYRIDDCFSLQTFPPSPDWPTYFASGDTCHTKRAARLACGDDGLLTPRSRGLASGDTRHTKRGAGRCASESRKPERASIPLFGKTCRRTRQ